MYIGAYRLHFAAGSRVVQHVQHGTEHLFGTDSRGENLAEKSTMRGGMRSA